MYNEPIVNINMGDNDNILDPELISLQNRILSSSSIPVPLKEKLLKDVQRLDRMVKKGIYNSEYDALIQYVDTVLSIPFGTVTEDNLDIKNAKKLMDSSHYGMDVVKNLILDYLAVMQLSMQQRKVVLTEDPLNASSLRGSSANAPVMIFVGLQGVGKTSIAKSIANAMGRKFIRIPVGAMGSASELRGIPRGVPEAGPGSIVKALIRTQSTNPLILLDEIDKAAGNQSLLYDIMATLLEILDPEQNFSFTDKYIDYPVDLSKVFFICTANTLGTLSAALLDRMEVIRFTSYTDEEKEVIAKKYSFPKVLKNMGIPEQYIVIEQEVWPLLIRPVGFDAGLRQLERNLSTLARSAARKILEGVQVPIVITSANIRQFVLPDQGPLS